MIKKMMGSLSGTTEEKAVPAGPRSTFMAALLLLLAAACVITGIRIFLYQGKTLPDTLYVAPSADNSLPAPIRLVKAEEYTLYLPGDTDPSACYFSWEGGASGSDGARVRASGKMPVPAPGESRTYTFRLNGEGVSFTVTTLQGSSAVRPVFIEIDESQGTIEAMNGDPDHNASCSGRIYFDGKEYGLTRMKGRGNASWLTSGDKKSYNITLGEKDAILGMDIGKTGKYCLLSNALDHSLLRNRVGYDLGYSLGIGYDCADADVWINGVYQGLYLVTPKSDAYVPENGYVLENDNFLEPPVSEGGDPSFALIGLKGSNGTDLEGNSDNRITVKGIGDDLLTGEDGRKDKSEENLLAVTEEIRLYTQEAWDAVRSPDGFNGKGRYYTEYIDLTSFAKMFLVLEYSKDFDVCCGSKFFLRYGTGEADKLYAGPVWDLDNAFGTRSNNTRLLLREEIGLSTGYGDFFRNIRDLPTSIYRTLGLHADFMEEVSRVYQEYKEVFDAVPASVDAFSALVEDSAWMNFHRVSPSDDSSLARYMEDTVMNPGTAYEQTYYATTDSGTDWPVYVRNLRTFCAARSAYLEESMGNGNYEGSLPEEQAEEFLFEDVQDKGKYYYKAVYWAVYHVPQITAGEAGTRFKPQDTCTVGQTLLFLYNAAGRPVITEAASPYTDVPEGSFYCDAVLWAARNGIAAGKDEAFFGVSEDITRAEIVAMLYNFEGRPEADVSTLPFDDIPADAPYRGAVAWAAESGITAGRGDGRFDPDAVCTRAEIISFLYKLLGDS